jgi:thiol-disulfide isomerase/thioredoxin
MALAAPTRRRLAGLAATTILLAACGGDDPTIQDSTGTTAPAASEDAMGTEAATTPEAATDDATTDDATTDDATSAGSAATDEAGDEPSTPASGVVAIRATTPDGSTVSPADFAGTPVFVETFATWCSNCRSQLTVTQEAAAQAGEDAVFLALSVETDLDPAALATYASEHGFANIQFGVLSREDLATLEAEFGNAVLVPPSTPKFAIGPDGSVGGLTTGFESVDEILAQL